MGNAWPISCMKENTPTKPTHSQIQSQWRGHDFHKSPVVNVRPHSKSTQISHTHKQTNQKSFSFYCMFVTFLLPQAQVTVEGHPQKAWESRLKIRVGSGKDVACRGDWEETGGTPEYYKPGAGPAGGAWGEHGIMSYLTCMCLFCFFITQTTRSWI